MSTIKIIGPDGLLDDSGFEQSRGEFIGYLQELEKALKKLTRLNKADLTGIAKEIEQIRASAAKLHELPKDFQLVGPGFSKHIRESAAELQRLKDKVNGLETAQRGQRAATELVEGSLAKLRAEEKRIEAEMSKLNLTTQEGQQQARRLATEYRQLTASAGTLSTSTKRVVGEFSAAKGSYYALVNETKRLNEQLKNLPNAFNSVTGAINKNNPEAVKMGNQLARNNDLLKQQDAAIRLSYRNVGNYASAFDKAKSSMVGYAGQVAAAYLSMQALASAASFVFDANVQLSDSQADVQKTTGLTAKEVDNLTESLEKVDTRTATKELLNIATIAGQLGIEGKKNVEAFTKAIDVAVVALKDEFPGGAEEVATSLGKINNVFKLSNAVGYEKALLNIGSALNELGASGAATSGFIADVALRIGAVSNNAGIGLDRVFAYAATLEGLGYSAEVSGTALNNLIGKMTANTGDFYAIAKFADAKLTLKGFIDLVNNDADKALQLFFSGLNKGGAKTTEFNGLLGELEIKGANARAVITSLAKNVDEYQRYQQIANQQLENGTSLAAEAAIKNNNLAGSWDKLKKTFADAATNGLVGKFLKDAIDGLLALTKLFRNVEQEQQKQIDTSLKTISTNQNTAKSAQALLSEYEDLTRNGLKPTEKEKQRLDQITLKLRDSLGESVVAIDKETGALQLNKEAVKEAIKQRLLLANQEAGTLALRVNNIEEEIAKKQLQLKTEKNILNTRLQALKDFGLEEARARELIEKGNIGQTFDPARPDIKEANRAVTEFTAQNQKAMNVEKALAKLEKERAELLAKLKKEGFDLADVQKLFNQTLETTNENTSENTRLTDEEIKAQNRLLNAKDKLRIFELEQEAKRQDKKAEDPAGTEAARTQAMEQAAEKRKQIAALERNIALRGDVENAAERTLIYKQYAANVAKIESDLTEEQREIHGQLLSQMAEIDTLRLKQEADTLKAIEENENASYEVRQEAALKRANALIAIAEIERDEQIRAAKGSILLIEQAQLEFIARSKAIAKDYKLVDAAKLNQEAEQAFTQALLDLENNRDLSLEGEKEYQKERQRLENEHLQTVIDNLRLENSESSEALQKELELRRKINEEIKKSDEEVLQNKIKLLNAGLSYLSEIGQTAFDINASFNERELQDFQAKKNAELKKMDETAEESYRISAQSEEVQDKLREDYAKAKKAREEQLLKQENAIRLKQAKAARAESIFSIGLSAAKAAMAIASTGGGTYYADFGVAAGIQYGLLAALTAAQIAAVFAKPLPQFFKGTTYAPEGLAIVDEQGPELRISKGRAILGSNEGPRLTYLEQGDKIYTATETQRILQDPERFQEVMQANQVQESYRTGFKVAASAKQAERDYDRQTIILTAANSEAVYWQKKTHDAIANKPETHLVDTGNRIDKVTISKDGNVTRHLGFMEKNTPPSGDYYRRKFPNN